MAVLFAARLHNIKISVLMLSVKYVLLRDVRTARQAMHDQALARFRSYCNKLGIPSKKMPDSNCHYDVRLVNGAKVEIKAGMLRVKDSRYKNPSWSFNLHRHGVRDERPLDFYALYCNSGVGQGMWLIVPSSKMPKAKTITLGWRAMISYWAQWQGRFDLIKDFSKLSH